MSGITVIVVPTWAVWIFTALAVLNIVQHLLKIVLLKRQASSRRLGEPLTDEQLATVVLQTVYEGEASTPHRDAWAAEIGIPFARAIERKHGIGA